MRIKTLLISFIVGLFSLSLMSCTDHGHGPGGHSHGPVEQQEAQQPASSPDSITHDNIDSQ
jgi:hypothetical protein